MSIEETLENEIAGFLSEQIEGMSFETVAAGSSGPDLELLSNMNIAGKAFVSYSGSDFIKSGAARIFLRKLSFAITIIAKNRMGNNSVFDYLAQAANKLYEFNYSGIRLIPKEEKIIGSKPEKGLYTGILLVEVNNLFGPAEDE